MKKREKANFRIVHHLVPGTKVRAIYEDEDNDPSWYDAVIKSVEVSGHPIKKRNAEIKHRIKKKKKGYASLVPGVRTIPRVPIFAG